MSKFIIHTAAPAYDESSLSLNLLRSCYESSLLLAKEHNLHSIAIPLIGAGAQGFPKDIVLKSAMSVINEFLLSNEILVTLVIFNKEAFDLNEKLFGDIPGYIDDNYVKEPSVPYHPSRRPRLRESAERSGMYGSVPMDYSPLPTEPSADLIHAEAKDIFSDIDFFIKLDESFSLKLLRLIDAKGMNEVECYKKANVSKQTWYKIMNDKAYRPNKKTVLSFSIALSLTLEETQKLLASAGFTLSESSLFDVIIMYCLRRGIYDIFEIDSVLFKYDQETLFTKS